MIVQPDAENIVIVLTRSEATEIIELMGSDLPPSAILTQLKALILSWLLNF